MVPESQRSRGRVFLLLLHPPPFFFFFFFVSLAVLSVCPAPALSDLRSGKVATRSHAASSQSRAAILAPWRPESLRSGPLCGPPPLKQTSQRLPQRCKHTPRSHRATHTRPHSSEMSPGSSEEVSRFPVSPLSSSKFPSPPKPSPSSIFTIKPKPPPSTSPSPVTSSSLVVTPPPVSTSRSPVTSSSSFSTPPPPTTSPSPVTSSYFISTPPPVSTSLSPVTSSSLIVTPPPVSTTPSPATSSSFFSTPSPPSTSPPPMTSTSIISTPPPPTTTSPSPVTLSSLIVTPPPPSTAPPPATPSSVISTPSPKQSPVKTLPFLAKKPRSTLPPPPPPPPLPHTSNPLFEHQPFIVSWNIPDLVCNRFNVSLDTSAFKGVSTPAKVPGQFLSLFYTDRLGLYPHVNPVSDKHLHGGIPQRLNLTACLNKARADVGHYIPSKTSRGLAVIDWEEWRPLWDRNWGSKRIYQELSVKHVLRHNRSLSVQEAAREAKQQFQVAARSLMSRMLEVGRTLRPNYLWGFYLFPNCYNYGWTEPGYTGRCSRQVRRQNDQLLWLWEASSALYPSVYLQVSLADNPRAAMMVRNRVQEALRVSLLRRRGGAAAPVFVYTRPVFVDHNRRFLSQGDLVSTIGESAAVGASGAVLWGASADFDDQASCRSLSSFLSSTLNPYVANVSSAAALCSSFLCRGGGRCVRKNHNSRHYLHLNPRHFRVKRTQEGGYRALGRPSVGDLKALSRGFTCQCYKGLSCGPRTHGELSKALRFSLKEERHRKAQSLNKAAEDERQRATKDGTKTYNYKV